MTAVTLPGAILGLLRRGSPVTLRPRVYGDVTLMHGGQGVVHDAARGVAVVDTFGGSPRVVRYGREDVALDLTDPTGRAHAAWLVVANCDPSDLLDNDSRAVFAALSGEDMKPEDIERLRLVCLHVAGVSS